MFNCFKILVPLTVTVTFRQRNDRSCVPNAQIVDMQKRSKQNGGIQLGVTRYHQLQTSITQLSKYFDYY